MAFTQIQFLDTPKNEVRYRTGLTNYDEILTDGRWVGRYWNSTGFIEKEYFADDLFDLPFPALPIEAFNLEIDGQRLHFGWKFVNFIEEEPNVHSIVELESEIRPVRVRIHTRLDGTPIMTRWLEITNLSDKPAALSKLSPWSGLLSRVRNWRDHMPEGCDDVF